MLRWFLLLLNSIRGLPRQSVAPAAIEPDAYRYLTTQVTILFFSGLATALDRWRDKCTKP
jgi:hypothetical protein